MTGTPLVDASAYLRFTGDRASAGTDVTLALTDALAAVDEHCNRTFAYGTYTETLYVYPDGKVYPSATPLVEVINPAGQANIQGAGVWIGWWDPFPVLAATAWSAQAGYPPQTTLTYSGGYQPYGVTDGPTPQVPVKIARVVAQLAYKGLHPLQLPDVPAGVNSVHVGDVGYSGPRTIEITGDLIDDAMEAVLAGFVRRPVRAWQSNVTPA